MMEKNRILWDCDSALYDSFELKSFKRQLESAIVSRTLSMPRLSEPVVRQPVQSQKKKHSKFGRSINKLLRSVFRRSVRFQDDRHDRRFYVDEYYSQSSSLATIPEVSEKALDSPEFDPVVRKTVSERFTSTAGWIADDADVLIRV